MLRRAGAAVAGWILVALLAGGCGAGAAAGSRRAGAPAAATGPSARAGAGAAAGSAGAAGSGRGTPPLTAQATATATPSGAGSVAGATTSSATRAATPSAAGSAATASASPAAGSTATASASPAAGSAATASASPAAGGPRPAAPSPASLPRAIRAVEGVRLASPAVQVASGPALGDLAAVTENHNLHIFLDGVAQPLVPRAGYAAWVPGSDWVIASRLSQPTIQGARVLGYRALLAGGRQAPLALPACTAGPPQGLPGPAVALVCGHTLEVAKLAAGGFSDVRSYPWTAQLGARSFRVDTGATLVAALLAKSCYVRVFALPDGTPWPGTYMAAHPNCPDALAWSGGGTLAIAAFPGVTLWSPGHVATFAKDGDFHALAWTAAGLLTISSTPQHPPWAEVIASDGSTARAVAAPSATVLGLAAGGRYAWLAVSFAGKPATYGIAATGA